MEKYLEDCLNSLVNQTLKEIEIIVVNDGSKDNSQIIIDKYVEKYPTIIKSFIKKNGGLSSARNYGIKKAKGEYIAFVDSDDYVKLNMYERMYSQAKQNDLDIVICDTINVYPNGKQVYMKSNLRYSDNVVKNYLISPPMAPIRIYKRKIFDHVQFEENIYYEDLNLTLMLVKLTNKIDFIDEAFYFYRQRKNSIMHQQVFNERLLDIFRVLDNNYNNLYNDYSMEVEYLYITHLLRTATLRFLNYSDSKKNLNKINDIMKKRFPNWSKNIYYKKSSIKLKLICFLAYNKFYFALRLIKNK